MTKRINAKHKIDRRLGVNLWGRAKSPFNKRSYGPGQHGQNRSKPSDYAVQLRAKQKLKGYYGSISEKQFRAIYQEAVRRSGDTSENLIEILERRLDSVVYRMKLASTVFGARQIVSHGHVRVNGKRLNFGSYQVRDGDMIELAPSMRENVTVMTAIQLNERDVPDYLEVEDKGYKAKYIRAPKFADVPYPVQMEPHLVIEFYSR
ncbi:MAG TPA: 30S ribosomal protein S4 [Alphaproteobacteria bacterium]|nr:30S ribosomal protein S4 [Alphaproteobacteria bacterium]